MGLEWQPTWYDWLGVIPKPKGTTFMGGKEKTDTEQESNVVTQTAEDISKKAEESEALAEQEARDAARRKLASQTRTIYTSGLGLTGKSKNTLGA